jgi:hypothetical protein
MAYLPEDKRRVYLACKPIFAGNNVQLRRYKKICELVKEHEESLRQLIDDFTTGKVINILKILLERDIFQSDIKAKIEFPELYLSSPARDVQRAVSEDNAARSVAEALDEIASREDKEDKSENAVKSAGLPSTEDSRKSAHMTLLPRANEAQIISRRPTFWVGCPYT